MPITAPVIETFTITGRDYEVFRVGGDPRHSAWNLFGIRPMHTAGELSMQDSARPYLPYAYASPIAPSRGWVGHPDAPIAEGWQVMDEMNRVVFGHAVTFAEMAQIAADSLKLP